MRLRNYTFEFEDQSWLPGIIREGMTDYLRYMLTGMNFYQPIIPLIIDGLDQTQSQQIIDLCSGGGGTIQQIENTLSKQSGNKIQITLTDKYPNSSAFEFIAAKTKGRISFSNIPVDAANVPDSLKGFRTIFSGFHHFNKTQAKSVIRNAVEARSGIGIFDGGNRNIFIIVAMILIHPIAFLLLTPFFKPFRLSRFVFTYLIPIIPICTIWDGINSIIRLYRPVELLKMARQVENKNYAWKAGKLKNKWGMNVTYLTGYPLIKI